MKLRAFSLAVLVMLVLAVIAYLSVRASVIAYLRGERFRHNAEAAISKTLRAPVEFQKFNYAGTTIYSEGMTASGEEQSPFASLKAEQLRADFDLSRVLHRAVEVRELTIQRLEVQFDGPRTSAQQQPTKPADPESRPRWLKRFLPQTVELKRTRVQELTLGWTGGALRGTALTAEPDGQTWQLALTGGNLGQAGFPAAKLESARLRYNAPSLFITESKLTLPEGGHAQVDGEVTPGQKLDLHITAAALPITPFLTGDWRARLHGNLTGDARIQAGWPPTGPKVTGSLQLVNGRLEALPLLDQIALFTGTQQFRMLELTNASANFTQNGALLEVKDFRVESAGLLRVEGGFTVRAGQLDGTLQVGVNAGSLRWLPGAQERVFNTARDGYVWTPVRVSGPVEHPSEDLTVRLLAAARDKVLEDPAAAAKQGAETILDLLKGLRQ